MKIFKMPKSAMKWLDTVILFKVKFKDAWAQMH